MQVIRKLNATHPRDAAWCASLCVQDALDLAVQRQMFTGAPYGEAAIRQFVVDVITATQLWAQDPTERRLESKIRVGRGAAVLADGIQAFIEIDGPAEDREDYAVGSTLGLLHLARAASALGEGDVVGAVNRAADVADTTLYGNRAVTREQLAKYERLVQSQIDPVEPTPEQVRAARPEIQVAWDLVSSEGGLKRKGQTPREKGTLVDAVSRAIRMNLDWNEPLERAVAERTSNQEEAEVASLIREGKKHAKARTSAGRRRGHSKAKSSTRRKPRHAKARITGGKWAEHMAYLSGDELEEYLDRDDGWYRTAVDDMIAESEWPGFADVLVVAVDESDPEYLQPAAVISTDGSGELLFLTDEDYRGQGLAKKAVELLLPAIDGVTEEEVLAGDYSPPYSAIAGSEGGAALLASLANTYGWKAFALIEWSGYDEEIREWRRQRQEHSKSRGHSKSRSTRRRRGRR